MDYLSVCSGIEAASVAWHDFAQPVGFAEIAPFPAAVLAHRFPTVRNWGDLTAIAGRIRAGEISAPAVLVGGTPCQAFSLAGGRASLDDPRGQLTLSFVELADAIDAIRLIQGKPPCTVLWENVPGCLNTHDNAFGCFLAKLAGEAMPLVAPRGKWANAGLVFGPQRAIAWRVLDAQYFGLPQRRARVFVIATSGNRAAPGAILFDGEGVRRDSPPIECEGLTGAKAGASAGNCWWDGGQLSQTLDAVLYKKQAMPEKNRFPAVIDGGRLRYITPIEAERLQGFPDDWTAIPWRGKTAPDTLRYLAIGNSMAVPVIRWIGLRIAVAQGLISERRYDELVAAFT